jgi:PAS domain S-box-containing protein
MDFNVARFSEILVRSMCEAIVYADAEGRIRFWNSGAERIFGFAEADALGQSVDIIIPEALRKRHWDGFSKTMHTGESRYQAGSLLAVPAIRKDGARISVEFTIVPFHDEAGSMSGIAAIMRDVTKQFEEMRALRKQGMAKAAK